MKRKVFPFLSKLWESRRSTGRIPLGFPLGLAQFRRVTLNFHSICSIVNGVFDFLSIPESILSIYIFLKTQISFRLPSLFGWY